MSNSENQFNDLESASASKQKLEPLQSKSLATVEVGIFAPEVAGELTEKNRAPQRRSIFDWERLVPRRGRVGSAACGVAVAALHLLIVAPLLPGQGHQRRVTRAVVSGSSADVQPTLQASIIEESPLAWVPPPATAAVTIPVPERLPLVPPRYPAEATVERNPSNADIDAGGSSALAGRYLGQIDARIERAWLKPRTPLDSDTFRCEVRVEQDAAGNVLEIELEQCGDDGRWQQSLVSAIQSASPLPAPPDPTVFRKSLHLSFIGHPWSAQESAEGFEPLTARAPALP